MTGMSIRITQQSISASTLRGLQGNLSRMQDLQARLSDQHGRSSGVSR